MEAERVLHRSWCQAVAASLGAHTLPVLSPCNGKGRRADHCSSPVTALRCIADFEAKSPTSRPGSLADGRAASLSTGRHAAAQVPRVVATDRQRLIGLLRRIELLRIVLLLG
jgi:hypothetical protein